MDEQLGNVKNEAAKSFPLKFFLANTFHSVAFVTNGTLFIGYDPTQLVLICS